MRITLLSLTLTMMLTAGYGQERSVEAYLSRSKELYTSGLFREAKLVLQRAADAARHLGKENTIVLSEVELYTAMCEARLGDGIDALRQFVAHYPTSSFRNEALLALGTEYYEQELWEEATATFEQVDVSHLTAVQSERLSFECGHAYYKLYDVAACRKWLANVAHSTIYGSHARYMLGYLAYEEEDYATARSIFASFANDPHYAGVIPYYMLHVEYMMKNYEYVVVNVDDVLKGVGGSRHQELHRMGAECQFRMENWSEAYKHISALEDEIGDAISREENYIAGYSLYRLGEIDRAADYLHNACGADDTLTRNAAYHLADCRLKQGDKEAAMHSFSMAYSVDGNDPITEDAMYNYCKLLAELGTSQLDSEILKMSDFIVRFPHSEHRQEIEGYLVAACYSANDLKAAYGILEGFNTTRGKIGKAMQSVAYYYAAECYTMGNYEEASEYAELALDLSDHDKDIYARTLYLLGNLDYHAGNYKMSASMFRSYLSKRTTHHADYPYAYYNMAYAKYSNKQYKSAYNDFKSFLEMRNQKDEYYDDANCRMGDAMAATGSYKQAIKSYEVVAEGSSDARHYAAYRIATMHGLAGDVDARIKSLQAIVNAGEGPYVATAHYEWGTTLIGESRFAAAAEVFETFVEAYPKAKERPLVLGNLALAYRNLGKNQEALAVYHRIVSEDKSSMAAHNALGEIRTIYMENNDVDGFFAYADQVGMNSDLGAVQRDSLSYVAAQRVYILGDKRTASTSFDKYLSEYPSGIYSDAALYYSADCRAELGDVPGAQEQLSRLVAMPNSKYIRRGYEKMARLAIDTKDWATVNSSFQWLVSTAGSRSEKVEALTSYLAAVLESGDNGRIVEAALYVESQKGVPASLVRRAQFERAKAEQARGNRGGALEIYNILRENVANEEGAESAYRVIEMAYDSGNYSGAESLVFEFASKNTPYQYWLAKSFLVLGDVYVTKGNLFQARATYQSVVDGYSNQNDGVVAEARVRVASLNDSEHTTN